jgi:hypothetical protein
LMVWKKHGSGKQWEPAEVSGIKDASGYFLFALKSGPRGIGQAESCSAL